MLLQTNSYIVPKEKRAEHARLMRRFRQILHRLGCDSFEVYEQVGANWSSGSATGRFVQIMRFRDRKHQLAVQNAERSDPTAQELIAEFCELVNYPYQQQNGLFAIGFYGSVLPVAPSRVGPTAAEGEQVAPEPGQDNFAGAAAAVGSEGMEQAAEETSEEAVAGEEQAEAAQEEFVEDVAIEEGVAGEHMPVAEDHQPPGPEEAVEEEQVEVPAAEEPGAQEGIVAEGEAALESQGGEEGGAMDEAAEPARPAAPAQPAGLGDWSLLDEAYSIDDGVEEVLGLDIEEEPASSGQTPPAPSQRRPDRQSDIESGLDEDEDDLARMAERLAEPDDTPRPDPKHSHR